MQFVSIFYPLLGVYRSRRASSKGSSRGSSERSKSPTLSQKNRELYSMASLEMQIEKNVDPLLKWASQKDFTAENVVFLRAVRDFKRKWETTVKRQPLTMELLREFYEQAGLIFFTLVHTGTARFNINIDSKTYNELAQMFSGLQYNSHDDDSLRSSNTGDSKKNEVSPWAEPEATLLSEKGDKYITISDVDRLYQLPVTEITPSEQGSAASLSATSEARNVSVPPNFTIEVFDKAFKMVKEDIFNNTWKGYEERFSKPRSSGKDERHQTHFFSNLTSDNFSVSDSFLLSSKKKKASRNANRR